MDVFSKIREIVAVQFNLSEDEISEDTSFFDDLNADSIDLVHLVMTLEDEYELEVEDDQLENIETVGDAVEYIEKNID